MQSPCMTQCNLWDSHTHAHARTHAHTHTHTLALIITSQYQPFLTVIILFLFTLLNNAYPQEPPGLTTPPTSTADDHS